jgi:hypothetical protein
MTPEQRRRRANVRLGLILAGLALAVAAVFMWRVATLGR